MELNLAHPRAIPSSTSDLIHVLQDHECMRDQCTTVVGAALLSYDKLYVQPVKMITKQPVLLFMDIEMAAESVSKAPRDWTITLADT